ncbi:MAG: hypothetical protein U0703_04815 [Anaerolineae bacterium]
MIARLFSVVLLMALITGGAAADSGTNICVAPVNSSLNYAFQADNSCVAPDAVAAARDACSGMTAGQVCRGAGDAGSAARRAGGGGRIG